MLRLLDSADGFVRWGSLWYLWLLGLLRLDDQDGLFLGR